MLISYLTLFFTAFLAATILPFYSEFILFGLLESGNNVAALVLVASLGNTLGSCVNWWIGLYLLRFRDRKWFYFSEKQIENAQRWFNKYGVWSLLFAWLPIGGDALTLIGGIMRVRFSLFVVLVGTGKLLRYIFVAYLAYSFY